MSATPCECKEVGFCQRHQCHKTAHWINLCRTDPAYFQAWEEGRGPCLSQPAPNAGTVVDLAKVVPPPQQPRTAACIFLGPVLSETDSNGTPCRCHWKWLRRCEIHGECATGDSHRRHSCNTCDKYEAF